MWAPLLSSARYSARGVCVIVTAMSKRCRVKPLPESIIHNQQTGDTMDWRMTYLRIDRSHHSISTYPSRRLAWPRGALIAALVLAMSWSSGCYHYRLTPPEPLPASPSQQRTVHAFFWGLLQPTVSAGNCQISNALDEVTMTTNFGYAFATVLTLGIWAPMDVEWRCAKKPAPDTGEEL